MKPFLIHKIKKILMKIFLYLWALQKGCKMVFKRLNNYLPFGFGFVLPRISHTDEADIEFKVDVDVDVTRQNPCNYFIFYFDWHLRQKQNY